MEIFIALTKYITCQRHGEGKPLLVVTTYHFLVFVVCPIKWASTAQGLFKVGLGAEL